MSALDDIAAERSRQICGEGWTPVHDDAHSIAELAGAAAAYAFAAMWDEGSKARAGLESANPEITKVFHPEMLQILARLWPWDFRWWKPKNPRRDLVRAGALIVAAIDRLDRASVVESRT